MQWIICRSKNKQICVIVQGHGFWADSRTRVAIFKASCWPVFLKMDLKSVLISSHWTGLAVFVRQHPSRFPSQHTDTRGCAVITGTHTVGEAATNWSEPRVGGFWCWTGSAWWLHAVKLCEVIKIYHIYHISECGLVQVDAGTLMLWKA